MNLTSHPLIAQQVYFMAGGEIVGLAIWVAGMGYSALCLGIPEIRLYYKAAHTKKWMACQYRLR